MENEYYDGDEPVEFQEAKRHGRYLGWGVALAGFGWSLKSSYISGIDGAAVVLAAINFVFWYGTTYALVYLVYFVLPVLLPPKDNDPPPPPPQRHFAPPQEDVMEATSHAPQRVQVVNRLVPTNDALLQYQGEIQAARAAGGMPSVTINAITEHTSAKKWTPGNPAKELRDALVTAGFIDYDGNWTDTGNKYSTPPTPKHAPTGGTSTGGNQWQPLYHHLQPVGEA